MYSTSDSIIQRLHRRSSIAYENISSYKNKFEAKLSGVCETVSEFIVTVGYICTYAPATLENIFEKAMGL